YGRQHWPIQYLSGKEQAGEQAPDNATHAWVECRLPQLGWVGFDPTNRRLAGERHIRIAVGRDYRDVSPTRGILQGGQDMTLEVDVQVRGVASVSAGGTAA
ncbi:MAG: transglutaminase family protein, partial [Rhodospirillaceae bacterium]|nr:transglutaminase family protein [Rhodospirillaceae bacterium]